MKSFYLMCLSIENKVISFKMYFKVVNFPYLDGDVPKATSYGVYISQLIRFSRACSSVEDLNNRNMLLTETLLKHGNRYHKLPKRM